MFLLFCVAKLISFFEILWRVPDVTTQFREFAAPLSAVLVFSAFKGIG